MILAGRRTGIEQYEFSGRTVKLALAGVLIAIPLLIYTGANLLLETVHARRVSKLRADNQILYASVKRFESRLVRLERGMDSLSEMDKNLRRHARLPEIPDEIRQLGIGGTTLESRNDVNYLLPTEEATLTDLDGRLDALFRSLKLEELSYDGIRDELKNSLVQLRSTPYGRPVRTGSFTSSFGYRRDPYTRQRDFHHGQDISIKIGTSVYATADGEVIAAKYAPKMGRYIKIKHDNGYQTIYGHLRILGVREGQRIKRGNKIGESGDTGRSTAPHLHYEVRHYNLAQNPINYIF